MLIVNIILLNGTHKIFTDVYSIEVYRDGGTSLKDYDDGIMFSYHKDDVEHICIMSM